jgi:hypothetical protein
MSCSFCLERAWELPIPSSPACQTRLWVVFCMGLGVCVWSLCLCYWSFGMRDSYSLCLQRGGVLVGRGSLFLDSLCFFWQPCPHRVLLTLPRWPLSSFHLSSVLLNLVVSHWGLSVPQCWKSWGLVNEDKLQSENLGFGALLLPLTAADHDYLFHSVCSPSLKYGECYLSTESGRLRDLSSNSTLKKKKTFYFGIIS